MLALAAGLLLGSAVISFANSTRGPVVAARPGDSSTSTGRTRCLTPIWVSSALRRGEAEASQINEL